MRRDLRDDRRREVQLSPTDADSTVAVAVAGIVGTLAAAVAAPWVSGRVQRTAVKEERIHATRLDAYVDLLQMTGQLVENFTTWSPIPLAEVDGPPS